jgi:hypothetical protein
MVLRPSARSSSRILAYASRKWLAGPTSSLAWTAVVAPASANLFQLWMTLGEMSSSRLSSARVFSFVRMRWTVGLRAKTCLPSAPPPVLGSRIAGHHEMLEDEDIVTAQAA